MPFGASSLSAEPTLLPLPLPIANSQVRIGYPRSNRHSRYITINIAPPFCPHIYGNFHTFPRPIAHPADTRMNPSLEANFSLSPLLFSLLIHFSFHRYQYYLRQMFTSSYYILHCFFIYSDTYPVIVTYITAFVCLNFYSLNQIFPVFEPDKIQVFLCLLCVFNKYIFLQNKSINLHIKDYIFPYYILL